MSYKYRNKFGKCNEPILFGAVALTNLGVKFQKINIEI